MRKSLTRASVLLGTVLLTGCGDLVVMSPSGDVAQQQSQLIVYSTILMLIIIVPVMLLTAFCAWHYRASNDSAPHEPEWDNSISLEIVVWTLPLAIIICLAGLTWVATHRLSPYEDLRRISAEQAVDENVEPLQVQVVALDWKWLFIYPEQGVAAVNEMAAVVDRPVEFHITSTEVMNAFYVPALAGMIYAMPGMQTEMNAVINRAGRFDGFSSHYSGAGFSHMNFDFLGMSESDFDQWVSEARGSGTSLDRDTFVELAQPSEKHPVTFFRDHDPELWRLILNQCYETGTLCKDDMMMVDALGGGGLEGLRRREMFADICTADDPVSFLTRAVANRPSSPEEPMVLSLR